MPKRRSKPAPRRHHAIAASSGAAPQESRGNWWRLAVILLAGVLTYANSLPGPFVFDDRAAIVENPTIRDWTSPRVLTAGREMPTAGRPLVNLLHAINYAVGGLEPFGYHAANLGLHLLCAMLLFGCIRLTLGLPRVAEPLRRRASDVAFFSALIWAVHPLNSEVVDYVTQRSESMMALFYFTTIYCSGRALVSNTRAAWQVAAVAASALGMLCKESMVTVPAVVWLYDTVFAFGSPSAALRKRWPLYAGLCATWLVLAAAIWNGPRIRSAGFSTAVSPWTYLANQTVMITRYFKLVIWPRDLVVAYGPPAPLAIAAVWPYAVFLASVFAVTVVALRRRPLAGFVGAWIFITLAPASSIVPIATEVGAERRMYLPLAALIALGVASCAWAADRLGPRQSRRALAIACLAAAAPLAAATIARNREYASPVGLARTVLARWPTPFAHAIVGTQLAVDGRHDEAIAELRIAAPGYALARYHLGGELFNRGAIDEAAVQLEEFVRLEPSLAEAIPARTMIGRADMIRSKVPQAIEQFRLVLAMTRPADEAHTTALGFLADATFGQQNFREAVDVYRAYLEARPRDVGALVNLGVSLAQMGRQRDAAGVFQRALDLDPHNLAARTNLSIATDELRSGR